MVGDTGIEPVTSSVSVTSGRDHGLFVDLYALLAVLVLVGLRWPVTVLIARSSPEFLQTHERAGCRSRSWGAAVGAGLVGGGGELGEVHVRDGQVRGDVGVPAGWYSEGTTGFVVQVDSEQRVFGV